MRALAVESAPGGLTVASVDVSQKLDEITAVVNGARSMPMSASCVVNRAELLAMLEEAREALPGSLAQAQELLGGREQMVAEAESEAQRVIDTAHAERNTLISGTEIAQGAQQEADRILAQARKEAEEVRQEADFYVDSKLANFEVVLSKTIGSVERGREKLLGSGPGSEEWNEEFAQDAPERSSDPRELRERADSYVDARLGSVAAVLAKTLEAVGRGRLTLQGQQPTDELGALMTAQDEAGRAAHTSDADFLADLATIGENAAADGILMQQPRQPVQEEQPLPQPVAQQQDAYYGQDSYAYQQQVGYYGGQQDQYYAPQQGYGQQGYGDYGLQDYGSQPQQQLVPYQEHPGDYGQQPQVPQLDETSFFDTSMIDLEQVRRYEQEQGYGPDR